MADFGKFKKSFTRIEDGIKGKAGILSRAFGWHNYVMVWAVVLLIGAFSFISLFNSMNSDYLKFIGTSGSDKINEVTETIFSSYMNIVFFLILYIVCSLLFCFAVSGESADYTLFLVVIYLSIAVLTNINDINAANTLGKRVYDIVCSNLYELSVVPIILYVTLKMKIHRKKMLILLFCELITCVMYLVGTFASDDSPLSLLKNVGCSIIFLVVFVALFIFSAIEYKDGNSELESLVKLEVLVLVGSALVVLFSLVFKTEYYILLKKAFSGLIYSYDINPVRELLLQDILVLSVVGDICIKYAKIFLVKREVRRTLETESALSKEYALSLRSRVDEVRTIKHDIKNHIGLLKMYHSQGDYEKLGEYLSQLEGGITELRPLTYSKNRLIDYILMSYSEKFREESLEFSAMAAVGDELPLSDSELCSLITNMLSNAFEACKNSKEENGGGYVSFKMTVSKSKVQIKCENSCDKRKNIPPTNNALETEKPNRSASHGYGMSIIKNICEKHGGAVLFSAEDGVFYLSAVLPFEVLNKPEIRTEQVSEAVRG